MLDMSSSLIKKKIVFWRVLLGVALFVGGLLLIYLQIFTSTFDSNPLVHRISIGGLILAGGMALFGGVAFFTSMSEVCTTCNVELESGALMLSNEVYPQLSQAIQSKNAEAFLFVAQAPRPNGRTMLVASLHYSMCPRCRQVARVQAALKEYVEKQNAEGEYITKQETPSIEISGPFVQQMIQPQ